MDLERKIINNYKYTLKTFERADGKKLYMAVVNNMIINHLGKVDPCCSEDECYCDSRGEALKRIRLHKNEVIIKEYIENITDDFLEDNDLAAEDEVDDILNML